MRVAIVGTRTAAPTSDDRRLADALRAAGAEVVEVVWDTLADPDGRSSPDVPVAPDGAVVDDGVALDGALHGAALALVRAAPADPDERERFLAWAAAAAERTALLSPVDVLRWNTHRSYLLELEDRGAPVMPTAWLAHGDRVALADLLELRGWREVELLPAVGPRGAARVDGGAAGLTLEAGQQHLDALLAHGDALVRLRPSSLAREGSWTVVVVDGEVSHAVRTLPPDGRAGPGGAGLGGAGLGGAGLGGAGRGGAGRGGAGDDGVIATAVDAPALDGDLARLAAWVVEATAVDGLALATVELVTDDTGTPQLVALDAVAPELHLGVRPGAAPAMASAVLRAAGIVGPSSGRHADERG